MVARANEVLETLNSDCCDSSNNDITEAATTTTKDLAFAYASSGMNVSADNATENADRSKKITA